ncbi:MAG: carbohydrate ABC transporter permease [Chloroflexota bacterium]|nr:carbohydrate ABC transporter permease [Chloroflexota bacterium]
MPQSTVEQQLAQERVRGIAVPGWQKKLAYWLGRAGLYTLLLFLSLTFFIPFFWMISSSLKNDVQTYKIPPILIPNPVRWENYVEALTYLPWHIFFWNSIVKYSVPSTIGVLISSILSAYGFSRIRWRGRDMFFFICIATMMIPFQVTMVPLFITFRKLHWINTYLPLVVPSFFGSPYFIFLLRQFFLTIPQELSDAARIDGCSELGVLFRIILPLSKPALAVVGLFQFMWCWNDYLGPLIYLNEQSQFPIALGLAALRASITSVSRMPLIWPYLMAASTTVLSPILIVFFFTQRTFIEGITVTGMKG